MSTATPSKHDALRQAIYLLRAKRLGRGHAYSCFLDEQPHELIPAGLRLEPDGSFDPRGLVVNESLRYRPQGDAPGELAQHAPLLDSFLRGEPLAWIEDPGTGVWVPYWVRDAWAEALACLEPGKPAPSGLDPALCRVLAFAKILVPPGYARARRAQWEEICLSAQAQFRAAGYVVVRDLIPPPHLAAMRRYYRPLVAAGHLPFGDSQSAGRFGLHSETLASFFHPQLAALVGRIAGEPAKPSYLYFASYTAGADLPRHTDREQCEFSISFLADYAPDRGGPCGWPLYLENPATPGITHAVDLRIGDALFYRGRELAHFREPLPTEHASTSVFLHYVRRDFAGALC